MANKISGSLDTNILLRLLLGDVPEQTKAVERTLKKGSKFEIADATLIELIFVLEKIYGMKRELVVENVFGVTRNSLFLCNKKLFEIALPLYLSEGTLSIVDCCLLVYARLNKATPLYTFDKKLIKKSVGDCIQPK